MRSDVGAAASALRTGPSPAARVAVTFSEVSENPLSAPWPGPYGGVPPWDRMTPELFPGAFEEALAERRAEIDAIVATTDPPSFENTIAAMERAGRTLDREWQPKLSEAADAILFNQGLFTRISAVYESLADSNLQPDQARVVTRIYEQFVRGGAHLNAADKQRLSDINQKLAARFAEFRAKVLADENTSTVAEGGEAIVNTRSSVDPFLTLSPRRDLREIVWKKFKSRGANADANDTTATI